MTQAVAVINLLYNNGNFKHPKNKVEDDIIYRLTAFFGIHFYNFPSGGVSFLGGEI